LFDLILCIRGSRFNVEQFMFDDFIKQGAAALIAGCPCCMQPSGLFAACYGPFMAIAVTTGRLAKVAISRAKVS